jgi:hypothetical protein
MNDHVISFVKSLAAGPCGCQYNNGRCSISTYDPYTGVTTPPEFDRGPRTHHCLRCRSREVLEADGIPYEKDDRPQWDWLVNGMKIDAATACKTLGEVWVGTVSGSADLMTEFPQH